MQAIRWLRTFLGMLLAKLSGMWRRTPQRQFPKVVYLESRVDPGSALQQNCFVIVGTRERPKWAKFKCPCGCGDTLSLNLMQSHRPCWQVTLEKDGSVTVFPSVDATSCKSHFWVRRSEIEWVQLC